jgi:DNA-binding MarR family transcriptional regulator
MSVLYYSRMKQSATEAARTSRPPKGTRATASPDPLFALLHAAEVVQQRLEEAMGTAGLSMAKYGVLQTLADAGDPMPLTELASLQRCVRSNITQLVDRLEADGLVKRVDDPGDRRSVRATLTAVG